MATTKAPEARIPKNNPERVEDGIFRYHTPRGEERWIVRFQAKGRTWRKFGCRTLTEARLKRQSWQGRAAENRIFPERELAQREQEQAQREEEKKRVPLLKDYAEVWYAACRAKLKKATLKAYRITLDKHLVPALGTLPMDAIKRAEVRELALKLHEDGTAPKTIHNIVRVLSAIFEQANEDHLFEEGRVSLNPAGKPSKLVKKPKEEQVAVFTDEEEDLILKTAKEKALHYYPFVLLLFRTGLRVGEASALKPGDLDFRKRSIQIQRNLASGIFMEESPKSGRNRKVDMAADLLSVLKEHVAMREAEAALAGKEVPPWLFTTPDGEIIRSNNFRDRVWRPLLKPLGIEYRCVHTIRHTFATRLIKAGVNPVYVQKQLGHATIGITVDVYHHEIEEAERNQTKTLEVDRLIQPPSGPRVVTQAVTQQTPSLEVAEIR